MWLTCCYSTMLAAKNPNSRHAPLSAGLRWVETRPYDQLGSNRLSGLRDIPAKSATRSCGRTSSRGCCTSSMRFQLSDEPIVADWLAKPILAGFSGKSHLQSELLIEPPSLPRWYKQLDGIDMENYWYDASRRPNGMRNQTVKHMVCNC